MRERKKGKGETTTIRGKERRTEEEKKRRLSRRREMVEEEHLLLLQLSTVIMTECAETVGEWGCGVSKSHRTVREREREPE